MTIISQLFKHCPSIQTLKILESGLYGDSLQSSLMGRSLQTLVLKCSISSYCLTRILQDCTLLRVLECYDVMGYPSDPGLVLATKWWEVKHPYIETILLYKRTVAVDFPHEVGFSLRFPLLNRKKPRKFFKELTDTPQCPSSRPCPGPKTPCPTSGPSPSTDGSAPTSSQTATSATLPT